MLVKTKKNAQHVWIIVLLAVPIINSEAKIIFVI